MRSISIAVGSKRWPKVKDITGVVLVGGESRRFGSNKALFEIDGIAMARVIADKLYAAEIPLVFVVGGSPESAALLGLPVFGDEYPGEGPLGGLITAMRRVSTEYLFVLPCDVPRLPSSRINELIATVTATEKKDAGVLTTTQDHWLCSLWRVRTCLPRFELSFAGGERAVHRAASSLVIARVIAGEEELINLNTLEQACNLGYTTK